MYHHTSIPIKDINKSIKFYQQLGFEVFDKWHRPDQGLTGIWIKDKFGSKIELVYHKSNRQLKLPIIPEVLHISIKVNNITITLNKLVKAGAIITKPVTNGLTVKRFAYIKDPNGFIIELVEL